MLGNLILFLATWGLLRFEGRSLAAIGLDHPRRRTLEFLAGCALYGGMQAIRLLAWAPLGDFGWVATPGYALQDLWSVTRPLTRGVLYEELLFRGYLLLVAMRLLGPSRGVLLSAVAFGAYHWVSYGILGQVIPMAWVFLLTGAAGYLFAEAFRRTGSILMPIGLHMGTNMVSAVVFSDGPWGEQWLVPDRPPTDPGTVATIALDLLWPLAFTAAVVVGLRRLTRSGPVVPTGTHASP